MAQGTLLRWAIDKHQLPAEKERKWMGSAWLFFFFEFEAHSVFHVAHFQGQILSLSLMAVCYGVCWHELELV